VKPDSRQRLGGVVGVDAHNTARLPKPLANRWFYWENGV